MADFPNTENPEIAKLYIAHAVALRAVKLRQDGSVDAYLRIFNRILLGIGKEPDATEE